jgi:DNA primase
MLEESKRYPKKVIDQITTEKALSKIIELYFPYKIQSSFSNIDSVRWSSCPFCNHCGNSPFIINHDRYYCFECEANGNSLTFLMIYKKWNYVESVEFLIRLMNVKDESEESKE